MDEDAAVEALDALGLSTYEAKVFIGLQKLGSGTASEVAEVTDVPRSQVYGAADALADYGLVDVQQDTPTRYRPVDVDEARERLTERLESTADRAFDYVEAVRGQHDEPETGSEAIWTVTGTDNISARAATLADDAIERVVYGTGKVNHVDGAVADALESAAERGVDVLVTSSEPAVGERVAELRGVGFRASPEELETEESTGRVLVRDADTILLSVQPTESIPHVTTETAFWSAEGAFATVLVTLVEERLGDLLT